MENFNFNPVQAWILAPHNARQKNRVMSDEGCFKTDTVIGREVKIYFISFKHKTYIHITYVI